MGVAISSVLIISILASVVYAVTPLTPSNFTATGGNGQVLLSWSQVSAAIGYNIYTSSGSSVGQSAPNNVTTLTVTGLTNGTQYCYFVKSYDANGQQSPATATKCATPVGATPAVPTGLRVASITGTTVVLDWNDNTDLRTGDKYQIYVNDVWNNRESTTSGYTVTNLVPGTTYTFRVSAGQAGSYSNWTATVSAVPSTVDTTAPTVPVGVSATPVSSTQINLSWTASSDNVGVTSYNVYRNGVLVASPTTTTFNDSGLIANTSYGYKVAAADAAGNVSAQSATVSATTQLGQPPAMPTGLRVVSSTDTSIVLSWNDSTDLRNGDKYQVYVNDVWQNLESTTNNYTVTGLTPGTTYTFRVSAGQSSSYGDWTAPVSGTTSSGDVEAPSIPTGLSATPVSSSQISLGWAASTDNVSVTGYKVYRNGVLIASPTGTSFNDTGLISNTVYSYTVAAVDAAGNASVQSSAVQATTTMASAPAVPTGLQVVSATDTAVTLDWNDSADLRGGDKYQVYVNDVWAGLESASSDFTVTGLTPGTSYTFRVSAGQSGSYGDWSAAVSGSTTSPSDSIAPTVPTNLSATAVSSSQINLSWTASTDNVGVAGYKVYRDGTLVASPTGTSYSNTGLTASTTYGYTVSAVDAAGNQSARTSQVNATTTGSTGGVINNRPAQPAAVVYGSTANFGSYAHPGGLVVTGRGSYGDPVFKSISAGGGTVLIYSDTLINLVGGRYDGLLLNSSECGAATGLWPGSPTANQWGKLNDFRVGSVLQSKLECVLEKMVAENPHMAGFFADDLGSRSWYPNIPWDSWSTTDKQAYRDGAIALSKTFRKVADRHGLLFFVNGTWNAGTISNGGGYPDMSQHGLSLADGGMVEHHAASELPYWNPYACSTQWASQSPVTNGKAFMWAITSSVSDRDAYANSGCFAYVGLQNSYDTYVAPWTSFHATGLPSHVVR
jgi:chitodextrinase